MPFPIINVRATGQNIDRLIKERRISIRTMQTYFGFESPRAIYRWLRGEHLPSVDHLFALSKLLHTPMQDILIEQTQDDQDVPPFMGWRLFDHLQRNLERRFFRMLCELPCCVAVRQGSS